ncbi:MAG: hypothetical protein HY594_03715 [Candidatus Omnitrophica bacterium]|nr:hypothetical protein [Candidatus Omnitrophota bacterium]
MSPGISGPIVTALIVEPLTLIFKNPFMTARGSKTESRNLKITVRLSGGAAGAGEACSSLAWRENSASAMQNCLKQMEPQILEANPAQALTKIKSSWNEPWARPAALSALECAIFEAQANHLEIPLWRYFSQTLGRCIQRPGLLRTSLTLSAWPLPLLQRAARNSARQQFSTLKLKVTGEDPQEDLTRLIAVHRAAPKARLIVDANQGFTRPGAYAFARAAQLLRLPVILFEQPVARQDLESMAWLTRHAGIPIVADESLCTVDDARALIKKRAARVLNVKISKCGLQGALEIIRLSRKANTDLMLGCMSESAQGLTPSVHLACGTDAFRYIDLDSHLLIKGPNKTRTHQTQGSRILICSTPT